jgi:hypothetical protein
LEETVIDQLIEEELRILSSREFAKPLAWQRFAALTPEQRMAMIAEAQRLNYLPHSPERHVPLLAQTIRRFLLDVAYK